MKSPSRWVRPMMLAVAVAWAALFCLDFGHAQPRGGIGGGGGGFRPAGGPVGGMPGQPVRPGFPNQPNFPRPNAPQPIVPGQPWNPNSGRPVPQPNVPTYVYVTEWRCSQCNQLIATGSQPTTTTCPNCGVFFTNGIGGSSMQMSSRAVPQGDTDWSLIANLGIVALFVLIPVGIIGLALLTKKSAQPRPMYTPKYQSPFTRPAPE